jgi:hypothetical protein
LLCSAFRFRLFSCSLPLLAYGCFHPCRSNASVDLDWCAAFHLLNSWHESLFEILTSYECGNASPAMNTTLTGSEMEWR